MLFYVQYLGLSYEVTFYDLKMDLQIFSIPKFWFDVNQLELTKGNQRIKMLRFSLKAYEINQWLLVIQSFVFCNYVTKSRNKRLEVASQYFTVRMLKKAL